MSHELISKAHIISVKPFMNLSNSLPVLFMLNSMCFSKRHVTSPRFCFKGQVFLTLKYMALVNKKMLIIPRIGLHGSK